MCTKILDYGATSQKLFNYNTNRLADATYYTVTIVDGYLLDGFSTGLFNTTEVVNFKIDPKVDDSFLYWLDEESVAFSTQEAFSITGISKNRTITAHYAASTTGLKYIVENDHAIVNGISNSAVTEIVLPGKYLGVPITEINEKAFYGNTTIASIFIPSSIKTIGVTAFYGCTSLATVTFSEGLETISEEAFRGCTKLNNVTIPNTVKSIGDAAFRFCSALTTVVLPDSLNYLGTNSFDSCHDNLGTSNAYDNCKYIPSHNNNHMLLLKATNKTTTTSYSIHADTKIIGNNAFSGCSKITSLTVPDGVEMIGSQAIYNCSLLNTVRVPSSLSSTEGNFAYCSALTYYESDDACYLGNESNNYVVLVKAKDDVKTTKTSYTIPETTKCIEKSAFSSCTGMTSVKIPSSVVCVGMAAFNGCTNVTSFETPMALAYKGTQFKHYFLSTSSNDSFPTNYPKLATVKITSGTEIVKSAFTGCSNLVTVELPNTLLSIGSSAFFSCTKLKNLEIPSSLEQLGGQAFENCNYLNATSDSTNKIRYYGNSSNPYVVAFHSSIYTEGFTPILNSACRIIANSTFNGAKMPSFEIPESVVYIGNSAFNNCSYLQSIVIPKNVKYIGNSVFAGASALTNLTVDSNNPTFKSLAGCNGIILKSTNTLVSGFENTHLVEGIEHIGTNAFASTSITSVSFPSTLLSVDREAFNFVSSLVNVTINESIAYIGEKAFYHCSELISITYKGTEEKWNSIFKGDYWNSGIHDDATIQYLG